MPRPGSAVVKPVCLHESGLMPDRLHHGEDEAGARSDDDAFWTKFSPPGSARANCRT